MQKKIADYQATAVERQGVKQQRLMDISEKESHIKDLQASSASLATTGSLQQAAVWMCSGEPLGWHMSRLCHAAVRKHSL